MPVFDFSNSKNREERSGMYLYDVPAPMNQHRYTGKTDSGYWITETVSGNIIPADVFSNPAKPDDHL